MRRYEGLFILNTIGKEESIDELIEKVTADIESLGGKVETSQKMEKRQFARVRDREIPTGFYVNIIFESEPLLLEQITNKYSTDNDIYRVMFTRAPAEMPVGVETEQAQDDD
ncbi:MAG: 30S ribosomal protein S6 [Verrucomicrobia bacterium]|nr:30S ribosomal protein S6 [Verrucomicrobiota bacterium]MCF7708393.1 30S ribosomal protein S6 [Verrucomicrobiota bacterium]